MSTHKFTPAEDAEFSRINQLKIENAVEVVRRNYKRTQEVVSDKMSKNGYESVKDDLAVLNDFKTLLDSWAWLHAHYHHFQKYHAADVDAWDGGESYLGTECVRCEFSRSQQRAVDEYKEEERRYE